MFSLEIIKINIILNNGTQTSYKSNFDRIKDLNQLHPVITSLYTKEEEFSCYRVDNSLKICPKHFCVVEDIRKSG